MDALRIDRLNFLRRGRAPDHHSSQDMDVERQEADTMPLSPRQDQEMAERDNHVNNSAFFRRFSTVRRPNFPSIFSYRSSTASGVAALPVHARPSSSHYSNSPNPNTHVSTAETDDPESPKPDARPFSIAIQRLPSTRLRLPHLSRTWSDDEDEGDFEPAVTREEEGIYDDGFSPISDSNESVVEQFPLPTQPAPVALPANSASQHIVGSGQRRFTGVDPAEVHLAALADDGRERRRHHRSRRRLEEDDDEGRHGRRRHGRRHRHGHRHHHGREHRHREGHRSHRRRHRGEHRGDEESQQQETRPTPRHFLYCFPWIRSRRIRSQILRCFVSGSFLALLLTVYLALSLTKNINNSEFTILLILIILCTTIFFCHGLIRLCMMIVRPPPDDDSSSSRRHRFPHMYGPSGYAVPRRPIRVVLASDEEAAGVESVTTTIKPPAYGLWRESIRVDPDRFYWQRNEEAPADNDNEGSGAENEEEGQPRTTAPRPPSYASDDGITYILEAQPRSMAPTTDVPVTPHPSEVGRAGRPPPR